MAIVHKLLKWPSWNRCGLRCPERVICDLYPEVFQRFLLLFILITVTKTQILTANESCARVMGYSYFFSYKRDCSTEASNRILRLFAFPGSR